MAWCPPDNYGMSVTPEFSGSLVDKASQKPVTLTNIRIFSCLSAFCESQKNVIGVSLALSVSFFAHLDI